MLKEYYLRIVPSPKWNDNYIRHCHCAWSGSGKYVQQRAQGFVAGLQYRQVCQKVMLGLQLPNQIAHQVGPYGVCAANHGAGATVGLRILRDFLAPKIRGAEVGDVVCRHL